VVTKNLVEIGKDSEPIADAARVAEIILNRTSLPGFALVPESEGATCPFLFFSFGLAHGFVAPTFLLSEIDNTRRKVGTTVTLSLAVVAVVDREFRIQERNGKHFALAFLRSAPVFRA
jgi:hypothetical protein